MQHICSTSAGKMLLGSRQGDTLASAAALTCDVAKAGALAGWGAAATRCLRVFDLLRSLQRERWRLHSIRHRSARSSHSYAKSANQGQVCGPQCVPCTLAPGFRS